MIKERTEEEVEKAYHLARKMGIRFAQTHPMLVHHLDAEDYTQEAIIAWLEQRHIPYQLVDTYRKEAPVSRRHWVTNKMTLSLLEPINIDLISEYVAAEGNVEVNADKLIKLKAIQKIVNDMVDPRQQIIIIMKYTNDMTLTQIAKGLNISRSYASRLHLEALDLIREELELNGDK